MLRQKQKIIIITDLKLGEAYSLTTTRRMSLDACPGPAVQSHLVKFSFVRRLYSSCILHSPELLWHMTDGIHRRMLYLLAIDQPSAIV